MNTEVEERLAEIVKFRDELDQMIVALGTQMHNIQMADDIVSSLEDPLLQKQYAYEMLDMLKDYQEASNDVLLRLETYRQMEKGANLPTDFIYFKLAKQLAKP